MYVCMYVCMHACMHACVCVCERESMCVCMKRERVIPGKTASILTKGKHVIKQARVKQALARVPLIQHTTLPMIHVTFGLVRKVMEHGRMRGECMRRRGEQEGEVLLIQP